MKVLTGARLWRWVLAGLALLALASTARASLALALARDADDGDFRWSALVWD